MKLITIFIGTFLLLVQAEAGAVLTLPDALALARSRNPTLKALRHQPLLQGEIVTQARSYYLPNLEARAGYTAQAEPQAILTPAGSQQTQDPSYLTASLTLDATLYDFGRTRSRVSAAEAELGAAKATVRAAEEEILLATIQAYYRILEYQHELATAAAEMISVGDHQRVVQALFGEGVVTRNDLLQAEVRSATTRQQELEWKNRIANAWLSLAELTGQEWDFRAELAEDEAADVEVPAAGLLPALGERPDLIEAQEQIAASQAETGVVRSQYLPQLFARAEAGYVENSRVQEQTIYAATIGVRCNLFDGYGTTAGLRRAREEEARRRDRFAALQRGAEQEYRIARNNLEVAGARIKALAGAIAQAEENLRINRERYREQSGTATEVLDAQSLLTATTSSYHRARFDRAIAAAEVKKALGQL